MTPARMKVLVWQWGRFGGGAALRGAAGAGAGRRARRVGDAVASARRRNPARRRAAALRPAGRHLSRASPASSGARGGAVHGRRAAAAGAKNSGPMSPSARSRPARPAHGGGAAAAARAVRRASYTTPTRIPATACRWRCGCSAAVPPRRHGRGAVGACRRRIARQGWSARAEADLAAHPPVTSACRRAGRREAAPAAAASAGCSPTRGSTCCGGVAPAWAAPGHRRPRGRRGPGKRRAGGAARAAGRHGGKPWVPEAEVGALLGWAERGAALSRGQPERRCGGGARGAQARDRDPVGGLGEQLGDEKLAMLCAPEAAALAAAISTAVVLAGEAAAAPANANAAWRQLAQLILDAMAPNFTSPPGRGRSA